MAPDKASARKRSLRRARVQRLKSGSDKPLVTWLDRVKDKLVLRYRDQRVPVAQIRRDDLPAQLGFTRLRAPAISWLLSVPRGAVP
jgi:hypothetical protein